jgi:hypothetical protein
MKRIVSVLAFTLAVCGVARADDADLVKRGQ